MISPKNPEISFLIASLHLSPDAFFDTIYRNRDDSGIKAIMDKTIIDLTRNHVSNQDLRYYTPEVVDSWSKYVSMNEWVSHEDRKMASLFEFVRKIGNDFLLIQNGKPVFRIEKLDDWQITTLNCGEDLFVAAMLANKNIEEGYEPRDFQWNYILKSDFSLLNNLISQNKIVENHFHLGGSSPMVDLSWIYLMNYPFRQTERYKKFLGKQESFYNEAHSLKKSHQSDLEPLMKTAAYIRLWLFQRCVLNEICVTKAGYKTFNDIDHILHGHAILQSDEMESSIDACLYKSQYEVFDTKVDYAIRDFRVFRNENNSYIAGERHLNYCCLRYVFTHPSDGYTHALYYLYLLIKHHFNRFFVQKNNKTGFQNFREYNDRKDELIRGTKYKDMAVNMAIEGNIRENHLNQLEVRIAPEKSRNRLVDKINDTDGKAFFRSSMITRSDRLFPRGFSDNKLRFSDGTSNFFYVLHFIKGKDPLWYTEDKYALICREIKKREEFRQQAELFMRLRDDNEEICKRVFGIDAANNEVNFRPENFGTVFRYLASSKIKQDVPWKRKIPDLRKTYHVGEDFYEVVDGLRAIDEAVLYLELSQGDRIGHGVALGIDVDKWYERHPVAALPRQNKIDNIAWMLYKIREWGLNVSSAYYEKLLTEFEKLYLELYKESSPGLLAYMTAWQLRGDEPYCYFAPFKPEKEWLNPVTQWDRFCIRDRELYKSLEHNPIVYRLYHRYHFDKELKKNAMEVVTHEFNQDEFAKERVDLVKQLQLRMLDFVARKGIAVESCPSSNFLISNLDEFKEIPTFNLFPIRESKADFERLNVCINTDDQGVFYTNLVKEYTLLAGTLCQQKQNNVREYSDDRILNWVKRLIDYSKQLCFRTGDVEYYGIRSDNDLFEVRKEIPLDDKYVLPSAI